MPRAIYAFLGLMLATPLLAELEEPPVAVRTVVPDYPAEMRRRGISGVVMVNCLVDEKGNVTESSVAKASDPAFERPAVDAVRKWKFKPARQDGAAIAIRICIPVKFVANP